MIVPTESDIGRRVVVVATGWKGRRGAIQQIDTSYVWLLLDDETETYYGRLARRAVIRNILRWE